MRETCLSFVTIVGEEKLSLLSLSLSSSSLSSLSMYSFNLSSSYSKFCSFPGVFLHQRKRLLDVSLKCHFPAAIVVLSFRVVFVYLKMMMAIRSSYSPSSVDRLDLYFCLFFILLFLTEFCFLLIFVFRVFVYVLFLVWGFSVVCYPFLHGLCLIVCLDRLYPYVSHLILFSSSLVVTSENETSITPTRHPVMESSTV